MTQQQLAYTEPGEREDPRNDLLDTMARQITDLLESAVRNDVALPLLARLESQAPALFRALAPAVPQTIPAPAPASCGSPAGPEPAVPARVHPDAELRLTRVLAALKLGHPKTPAANDLMDGAKMIVLADLAALRARRSVTGARRHTAPAIETAAHDDGGGFTFVITDAGSGE